MTFILMPRNDQANHDACVLPTVSTDHQNLIKGSFALSSCFFFIFHTFMIIFINWNSDRLLLNVLIVVSNRKIVHSPPICSDYFSVLIQISKCKRTTGKFLSINFLSFCCKNFIVNRKRRILCCAVGGAFFKSSHDCIWTLILTFSRCGTHTRLRHISLIMVSNG